MNFDPMTGEPVKKKFDPMTGEPIKQEMEAQTVEAETVESQTTEAEKAEPQASMETETVSQSQPAAEPQMEQETTPAAEPQMESEMKFDPMTGQPIGMVPKKKGFFKSKAAKIVLAVAIVAVIACGAVVVAVNSIFVSSSDKVLRAIKNTVADKGALTEAFDIKDIVKSNEFTLGFSVKAEGQEAEATCVSGKEGKQIIGSISPGAAVNIDFGINLTKDEFQIQIPYFSDQIFTYNYKEKNTGYLMEEFDSDEIKAVNRVLEYFYNAKYDDKASEELMDAVLEEYKSLEFKDVKNAKFEVDGKDRSCEGYRTIIRKENIQNLLDVYEKSTAEAYEDLEKLMMDFNPSYISGSYASTFDELQEELENMPEVAATFYLYDNKLACIELEPKGEIAIQIQFLGGDRRAQNICVIDEDGNVGFEVVGEKDGSTETTELFVGDESILSLEYDSKSGAFEFSAEDSVTSGSIKPDRDGLEIIIDQVSDAYENYDFEGSIFLKKGAEFEKMDGDKFDIGNASEDEVMDLMTEISNSLY